MSRFLYGALFMLGAGYALSKGVHIKEQIFYTEILKLKIEVW